MKECDKNQDGKIDFNEFFNAMIQWNIIKIIGMVYLLII
jgi:Ca2+-binding EF-hand superfamily protein